jgi:Na+-transporting NADH:ubiquinone oxidoreductase subunit NqrF
MIHCDECNEYNDLNFENCNFGLHIELSGVDKRENIAWLKLTNTNFSFWTLSIV